MTGAQRQDGFILLFALITSIIVLTLATASLAFVRLERQDTQAFGTTSQEQRDATSAIEEALALLHVYPDPKRAVCERNGGDPDDPDSCDYVLRAPDGAYAIDFSDYDYPDDPTVAGYAPADDPSLKLTITVDPGNEIDIATWTRRTP